jgi:hypothetical protein
MFEDGRIQAPSSFRWFRWWIFFRLFAEVFAMPPRPFAALAAALLLAACATGPAPQKDAPPPRQGPPPPLAADDFESGAGRWEPTDPAAWRVADENGNHALNLFQQSQYEPPVRSPKNIALLKDVMVGDFVLDLRVKSTVKDYPHRDLCVFFGHRDPSHFYYVHLGKKADPHSNSIFLVNGEPRVSIAKTRTEGTDWTDGWHRVRIVRKTGAGTIDVYFDDMAKPVMTAEDRTLGEGRIGVGSFDDTGLFDEVRVWGSKAFTGGP